MLIKLLLICGIVAILSTVIFTIVARSLSFGERIEIEIGYPPVRVVVSLLAMLLSWIATIVVTIITIITW